MIGLLFFSLPVAGQLQLPYLFVKEIKDSSFAANKRIFAGYGTELLYSYVGQYDSALRVLDKNRKHVYQLRRNDSLRVAKYTFTDAAPYILEQAKQRRIVIINEAHHISSGRVFSTALLAGLAKVGFNHFAVEGMPRQNDSLNLRGYPGLNDAWYYDPQYGNMLREALRTGYHVMGYDTADRSVTDPMLFAFKRDSLGAVNIKKILDAHPDAKIFIHCGYSHGYKSVMPDVGKRFALLLREMTGIDPFVINQDYYNEMEIGKYRLPLLPTADMPAVSAIRFDNGRYETDVADVTICHAPTRMIHNRPAWLKLPGRNYYFPAKHLNARDTVLVLAYKATETIADAMPADVIELHGSKDRTALVLERGDYSLLILDRQRRGRRVNIKVK
jgi:hypothetical protein